MLDAKAVVDDASTLGELNEVVESSVVAVEIALLSEAELPGVLGNTELSEYSERVELLHRDDLLASVVAGVDGTTLVERVESLDGVDGVESLHGVEGVEGVEGVDGAVELLDGVESVDRVVESLDGVEGVVGSLEGVEGVDRVEGVVESLDGVEGVVESLDGVDGVDGVVESLGCVETTVEFAAGREVEVGFGVLIASEVVGTLDVVAGRLEVVEEVP